MAVQIARYKEIINELASTTTTLIAVSKTKPAEEIQALLQLGQIDFGENYVQELIEKQQIIKENIRWHFIGHLQTNKVKYIIPFIYLIHSVDSLKLLKEINKQAAKINQTVSCLLQVYIAKEDSKFGMDETELAEVLDNISSLPHISVKGLMGMATLTGDEDQIRQEYTYLHSLYTKLKSKRSECAEWNTLSMGMSADYKIAIAEGSTMVRIGSLLFGERNYNK